jgi:hypothetical protein
MGEIPRYVPFAVTPAYGSDVCIVTCIFSEPDEQEIKTRKEREIKSRIKFFIFRKSDIISYCV